MNIKNIELFTKFKKIVQYLKESRGVVEYRAFQPKKLVQICEREFRREKMVYQVEASASVNNILMYYSDLCYDDNCPDCALRLLDAYDEAIDDLTNNSDRGCHLEDIPAKYRAVPFWTHLWLVYMVDDQTVYVDLIIDDRQNYGKIFNR